MSNLITNKTTNFANNDQRIQHTIQFLKTNLKPRGWRKLVTMAETKTKYHGLTLPEAVKRLTQDEINKHLNSVGLLEIYEKTMREVLTMPDI